MGAQSAPASLRDELDARDLLQPVLFIASAHRVTLAALEGRDRSERVRVARRKVFAYLHVEAGLSYPTIGRLFGRDHTTVVKIVLSHERPGYRAKYAADGREAMRRIRARRLADATEVAP